MSPVAAGLFFVRLAQPAAGSGCAAFSARRLRKAVCEVARLACGIAEARAYGFA